MQQHLETEMGKLGKDQPKSEQKQVECEIWKLQEGKELLNHGCLQAQKTQSAVQLVMWRPCMVSGEAFQ